MSRLGKVPVSIPKGVEVKFSDQITVKGPKGQIVLNNHSNISYEQDGDVITVNRIDDSRLSREQHGLRRTLLNNALVGVSAGYTKSLDVIGVGYKVNVQGSKLVLNVGYSHPVNFDLPKGVEAKVEGNKIHLSGCDKQLVGEIAATIRKVRPPEPYKGKGIKYVDEIIRRKAGKSGK